jgi:hypothetical protein
MASDTEREDLPLLPTNCSRGMLGTERRVIDSTWGPEFLTGIRVARLPQVFLERVGILTQIVPTTERLTPRFRTERRGVLPRQARDLLKMALERLPLCRRFVG